MSTIKNYSKLMEDLSKWKTNPSLWYDVTSYTSSTPSYNTYGSNFPIIIPFKVVDEITKREIEIPIEVKFSNEKGDVAINPNGKVVWNVNINVSQKEITYQLKYPFENFYTNKDEYAIIIETKSSFYFYQMLKYLKMNVEKGTASLNYILSSFKRAFTEAESSDEKLDWLYENALNVAIVDRGNDKLLSDMQTLSKYDRNKWFIDTGSGIVNLLQGFSDLKLVYDFFKNNPKITFEIYNTISDYQNKKFFSQFILAIGFLFMPENLKGMPVYIKGDGYVLARYVDSSQNEEKPFRLLNYVLRSVATPEDLKKQKARNVNYDGVQISIEERQLSPLDWVIVTNANVKKSSKSQLKSLPMPALYAYYLVDQKDQDNLMQDLRISLDILAIVAGVATFGASTGITAVIIALDIGLAATDLILMNDEVKDFLSQYEGGAWFVENWDIIYAVVGLGMITTLLLRGIAQNGPQLLEALKNVKNIGQKKRIFIKQLEDLITKATAYEAKNAIALEEVVVTATKIKPRNVFDISRSVRNWLKEIGVEIIPKAKDYILKWKNKSIFRGDHKEIRYFWDKILKPRLGSGTGGILKYLEVLSRNMVAQEHAMSCAAACIKQLAKDKGIEITEEAVRILAKTTEETGTFPNGIKSALEKIFKENEITAGIFYNPKIKDIDMAISISQEGSWITVIRPFNGKPHVIIVDKIEAGKVFIRDPWPIEGITKGNGVEAIINADEFSLIWAQGGNFAFKIK